MLSGRDLLGAAQTGTGKTAGFTLPLLQRLAASAPAGHTASGASAPRPVRALVLTPTRELAAQVEESIRTYGAHMPLASAVIYGGVGMQPQIDALRRGVDIVVATPGRLLDHTQQKTLDLGNVEILVLDEADRMLDMGFIHDIRRVLALLPKERQNLLFSATFSNEIMSLAGSFLKDPATVEVARRNTPAELVAQLAYPVDAGRKRDLLAHLVKSNDWHQVLVFVRTKHGANRLAEQLVRAGVEADAIHGNKSQGARTRALARFKDGSLRVLVATDIAARGLDIEELPHVVNYDLPHVAHDYVHRIGRTGRAGAVGEALSLVSREEQPLLAAIEKLVGRAVERRVVPGFEPGSAPVEPAASGMNPPPAGQRPNESSGRRRGRGRRRPEGRNAQPHPARPNESRRGPQPQRPPRGARPAGPRNEHRVYADHDEREAQLREARMRLAEERGADEQEGNRPERAKPVAALLNNPRRDSD